MRMAGWGVLAAWAFLAVAVAQVGAPPFTPVDLNVDLSLSRTRDEGVLESGWTIRPVSNYPGLMNVFDTGGPALLVVDPLPAGQSYLLKLKCKFQAIDQVIAVEVNGVPTTVLRPVKLGRAQKFSVVIPSHVVRQTERNRVIFQNHGAPGKTEYEQVRFINYRAVISKAHGVYLAFQSPHPIRWTVGLVIALLFQWFGVAAVVALLWAAVVRFHPVLMAQRPWYFFLPFIGTAGLWGLLLAVSGVTPYRLVFPGATFWTFAFLVVGVGMLCIVSITVLRDFGGRVVSGTITRMRQMATPSSLKRTIAANAELLTKAMALSVHAVMVNAATTGHALSRIPGQSTTIIQRLQSRYPMVFTIGNALCAWVSRRKVTVLLFLIVLYGFLLRYDHYQSKLYEDWNYLGTTTDSVLMIDAAARVLGTGTFMQFDGTYARVTGLAGYGLALLAMAIGGLYPGFHWLRLGLIMIGSLVPVAGFFVINTALGSAVAGLGVAALLASEPILVTESRTIYHDVPATLCAGIALYWLMRLLREDRFRPRLAVGLGLATGLTILAKMSHLCLVAVIIGSVVLQRWTLARWKNVGVALAVTLCVLGIWMGRNAKVLGMPILSSQSGVVFAASTGQAVWKPPGAGGEIATVGQEQRFNQSYVQQALEWITAHPREYATIAIGKIRAFWLEGPSPWQRSLLWGIVASLVILFTWERRFLLAMVPIGLYLVLYSVTFGFTWPALPTYYPPFLFLLILALAPIFSGTFGRLWQVARWAAESVRCPKAVLDTVALTMCCVIGLPFLKTPWHEFRQYGQQAANERAYLAWAGTVLPEEAIIVKTDLWNPWQAQQLTQRPVLFNALNGIPWFMHKTPYSVRDYQQDWQSVNFNPTSFRFDIARDHGRMDAALHLSPEELELFQKERVRGLPSIWRRRHRQLFLLDVDAKVLAESFLPANAYALRGDELAVKFYRAFPQDPRRTLYRLVARDDAALGHFGRGTEQAVIWQTAPCPERRATTIWFEGAFGKQPGLARLLVNGRYAMAFQLGATGDRQWTENGYRLEYRQRRPWWDIRPLTGTLYSVGTLTLTVPASIVTPGQPLTVSVSPLLVTGDPDSWFAVLNKKDTLQMLTQQGGGPPRPVGAQQIEGFKMLVGSSEVLRSRDDGRSGRSAVGTTDFWLARAQAESL